MMDKRNNLSLCLNLKQLEAWAYNLGSKLKGVEVIELRGDVGSGKTTMTKAVVSGSGCMDNVTSPSFTIKNEYKAPRFAIYHFDFYRLNDAGLIKNQLEEDIDKTDRVIIIEWSDIINDVLPSNRMIISFEAVAKYKRQLNIAFPDSYYYLMKDE